MTDQTSSGETANNYLEKIKPKDLVMFSPKARQIIAKNDFNYLDVDYDVLMQSDEEKSKIKVWGLPSMFITDPIPLGIFSGLTFGALFNSYRNRPKFANIYIHLATAGIVAAASAFAYKKMDDYSLKRELVVWDYVKKHPQDFPEVFTPAKKFKDMLLPWNPTR